MIQRYLLFWLILAVIAVGNGVLHQATYGRYLSDLAAHQVSTVTGILLIATDPISHTFWHFWEPQRFRGVDPEQAARLGQLIPNIYRHNGLFLERLAELTDPHTVTIIVSDHGFKASGRRP